MDSFGRKLCFGSSLPEKSMANAIDRFTATLSELRVREILDRRAGLFTLRVSSATGEHMVVVHGPKVTAGAHPDSDLILRDEMVSSVHFELVVDNHGATLRDLGSKNGTWISAGTVRVSEVWIEPGSTFTAGDCTITLVGIDPVEVPISTVGSFGELHGRGSKMGELFSKLQRLAAIELDVLVIGETGTGKELVAQGIHAESARSRGPFIVLDCTNLNEGIAESTLFGHRKGAFTGAQTQQAGLLEQSDGGTLFIDEIGELPLQLQPKLLRALENHETRRVGEGTFRRFDARIIAATNRDLRRMVNEGTFRADLYFRLAQMQLDIPPLRERGRADITLLADLFLDRFAKERGTELSFDKTAYTALVGHSWPGNVRELRNAIRYAALWTQSQTVTRADLPPLEQVAPESPAATSTTAARPSTTNPRTSNPDLEEALLLPIAAAREVFNRMYVTRILAQVGNNQTEAARRIDMSRSAFRSLVKQLKLA